jgi:O-antigen biosynthesis protein
VGVRSPLFSVLQRRRAATAWDRYLAAVEPTIAGIPRVHRFARPAVLGRSALKPRPLAVWIDGDGEAADATRTALAASTCGAAAIVEGSLHEALASTRAEHVLIVRAGDEPAPLALERLGQAAALADDALVITCDDDRLTRERGRDTPTFRPGPSPDRWLACDDSGPMFAVARKPALALVGQLQGGLSWRHELALRLAGAAGECHAHVPMLLCHRSATQHDLPPLHPDIVTALLQERTSGASAADLGEIRVIRRPLEHEPTVEVIICFRDHPDLLARCVASLLHHTAYERLRVALVDNGSRRPETALVLDRLSSSNRVRLIRNPRPFNFAALNNHALMTSDADVIVFLNNDTEILQEDWVEVLLQEALRPEVGAVGPLLMYPNGAVQHAGAAVGLHDYAGHPFAGLADSVTPFGYAAQGTRNWLAVTAACMMVERSKLMKVGGFDESFVVAGNDVDLCLRLTATGYRSLCVPWAKVLHAESRSRGDHVDPKDFVASERSYGEFRTVGDPFYNPNLTTRRTDCSVRVPEPSPA